MVLSIKKILVRARQIFVTSNFVRIVAHFRVDGINLSGISCQGKMYITGGRTDEPMAMEDTNALLCYEDQSDCWIQCAPMKHNRYYHDIATIDKVFDSIDNRPKRDLPGICDYLIFD